MLELLNSSKPTVPCSGRSWPATCSRVESTVPCGHQDRAPAVAEPERDVGALELGDDGRCVGLPEIAEDRLVGGAQKQETDAGEQRADQQAADGDERISWRAGGAERKL